MRKAVIEFDKESREVRLVADSGEILFKRTIPEPKLKGVAKPDLSQMAKVRAELTRWAVKNEVEVHGKDEEQKESEETEPKPALRRWCAVCGDEIPSGRLEALPDTTLCIVHAREASKYGGEFRLAVADVKTSKGGSLKKNFSGVDVAQVANPDVIRRLKTEHRAKTEPQPQQQNGVKKPRAASEPKPTPKPAVKPEGADEFGNRKGTQAAQINAAITMDPRTVEEIAQTCGQSAQRVKGHLRWLLERGFVKQTDKGWMRC